MSTVETIAAILNLFEEEPELGVREMSRRIGISKSAVQRVAAGLAGQGFLAKQPAGGQYTLGLRLLELGVLVQARSELVTVATPTLQALMQWSSETVHLATLDGINVVYVVKMESPHSITMPSRMGRLNPTYCTGVGKVLLAHQDPEVIERIIEHGLIPFTAKTITDPDELRAHLEAVRQQGCAYDDEERELGLRCVAAPIRDHTGAVVAAVSIAGPASRLSQQAMRPVALQVKEGAARISQYLGWRPDGGVRGTGRQATFDRQPGSVPAAPTRADRPSFDGTIGSARKGG